MHTNHTLETLRCLRLSGMAQAFLQQSRRVGTERAISFFRGTLLNAR